MHRSMIFLAHAFAMVAPALGENTVYTSGITGGSHPMITPLAKPDTPVVGPITISVTNSFGSDGGQLYASFGHNPGSPTAISAPTNGPIGSSFQAVYPAGWAGRIAIGKDNDPAYINRGSLIEASYIDNQPSFDVSYVQGFSIPIVCSCSNTYFTGCNIPLYHDNGAACPSPGPSSLCFNPLSDSAQSTGVAAQAFFEPCAGAAFTYPNDVGAIAGCASNLISCCIGSTCPTDPKQS